MIRVRAVSGQRGAGTERVALEHITALAKEGIGGAGDGLARPRLTHLVVGGAINGARRQVSRTSPVTRGKHIAVAAEGTGGADHRLARRYGRVAKLIRGAGLKMLATGTIVNAQRHIA